MIKILDLRFDQIMGRFGFIFGALSLFAAVAGLIVALRSGRPTRTVLFALVAALVFGGLLFGPSAPRILKAFWRFATLPPPPGPTGPLPVGTTSVALAPATGDGAAIIAQIWYPAASAVGPARGAAGKAPVDCQGLSALRLAAPPSPSRHPLLLYAPGIYGPRDDNASTATSLASHGYVVLAIDDIERDRPLDPAEPPFFDFSSQEAYVATLTRGADKAVREAKQALQVLDRLEACVAGDWRDQVQFDKVGFFGFSYGGGVAATAGILDPRVVAVANLDGWVFGTALTGSIEKPYLLLVEDEPVPGPHVLQSSDPGQRYYAILQQRFLREHARLMELPDKYGFRFRNVAHGGFTDDAFSREAFRSWLFADPARTKAIKDAYLTAFFDAYLRNAPQALLTRTPSPYRGVDTLKGRPHWADGQDPVPILAWMGLQ